MRVSLIQMDMKPSDPEYNFAHAEKLIDEAVLEEPDVLVLPETWNTGFFTKKELGVLSDDNGERVKEKIGPLARRYGVNIVAGSVANRKGDAGQVFNTSYIFDRSGEVVASYDKTHLFTPMGEHDYFAAGDRLCRFKLDDIPCGIIICYDVRFPELTRKLAVAGMDVLFIVSQWPDVRADHLRTLIRARAIENQMFVCCCNSCGTFGTTKYAGESALIDPWGKVLAEAGPEETIVTHDLDLSVTEGIRESINVFRDRREDLYTL